jgi:hypothetical protein
VKRSNLSEMFNDIDRKIRLGQSVKMRPTLFPNLLFVFISLHFNFGFKTFFFFFATDAAKNKLARLSTIFRLVGLGKASRAYLGGSSSTPALLKSIRLGCKDLPGTNTLAYWPAGSIRKEF